MAEELIDDLRQMGKLCEVYSPDQCATLIDGIGWIAARHKLNRAADELEALRKRCEAVEAVLSELREQVMGMKENPNRGDMVFRCGFNGAIDCVVGRIDQAIAAAQEPSHG